MDLENFESPAPQMATPYSAFFIFATGMFISNILFNTIIMKKPFVGTPTGYGEYFRGSFKTHMVGISGGLIWGLGSALSYMVAGKAGAAVSYALGAGRHLVAALWGLLIWKEFRGASKICKCNAGIYGVTLCAGACSHCYFWGELGKTCV